MSVIFAVHVYYVSSLKGEFVIVSHTRLLCALWLYQCILQVTLVHVFYYIKLKSRLSICLSALFGRSDSQPWLHGLTSDLLDVIAMSSGMTKFIFKTF